MSGPDEAYDRLHGVDGHTQAAHPRDVRAALNVLSDLSARSTDGRLRDSIARVRDALWDDLDAYTDLDGASNLDSDALDFVLQRLFDQRDAAIERLRAAEERVALLLCERHQAASPTRQPCAACSQDAGAVVGGVL